MQPTKSFCPQRCLTNCNNVDQARRLLGPSLLVCSSNYSICAHSLPSFGSLESDGLREKKVQNVILQQQRGLTSTTAPDLQGGHFEASLFKKKTKKKNRRRRKLTWEDKFAFLREFKKMFHHTEVPPGYIVNGFNLHGWVDTQRKEYLKYRFGAFSLIINERRIKRSEETGFKWSHQDTIMGHDDLLGVLNQVASSNFISSPFGKTATGLESLAIA